MAGESKITTNRDEIKKWAEERGGKPSVVKGTETRGEGAGELRINFPGYSSKTLQEISWEEFFSTFDQKNLAFLYQETTSNGKQSRFCKFVSRK